MRLSPKAYEDLYGKKPKQAQAAESQAAPKQERVDEREAAKRAKKAARTAAKLAEESLRTLVNSAQAALDEATRKAEDADFTEKSIQARIQATLDSALPAAKAEVDKAKAKLERAEEAVREIEEMIASLEAKREAVLAAARDPVGSAGVDFAAIRNAYENADAAWEFTTRSAKSKRDRKLMAQARRVMALADTAQADAPQADV